jgi:aldose 1-epimerase
VIDNAFTGLARDADGRAWLSLTGPDQRIVRLWVDSHYRYLEVYTGDTQPPEQRRRGLGVEPMTCPPNGLATGQDVLSLAPGESLTTRWGIHPD